MTSRVPMTPKGHQKLKTQLKHLKSVERPKNIADIERARGHGDLSENAEYDAAKERQGHLQAQIQEVERQLALAQVIDPSTIDAEKIVFGATVTIQDLENNEKGIYTIVGACEANITIKRISIDSPIARGLIGKEVGDEVRIQTPKGVRIFEVIEVEYCSID